MTEIIIVCKYEFPICKIELVKSGIYGKMGKEFIFMIRSIGTYEKNTVYGAAQYPSGSVYVDETVLSCITCG